jgi:hypothetical protein
MSRRRKNPIKKQPIRLFRSDILNSTKQAYLFRAGGVEIWIPKDKCLEGINWKGDPIFNIDPKYAAKMNLTETLRK